ncbi:hypothetical protein ERIC2_c35930 [Paenibacillus larvae subsp. larvae DSM 25430]|uniref:Transposase n=1 Tax=Paenibacillus larvae subsp. larvae DSM 25430 TaxID=697284 RepID=V9W8G1_9BACL|nr:hypothetical protein ERIC2_c35930 [Paenibacillus larvae subsp. larvae DSM 25430]
MVDQLSVKGYSISMLCEIAHVSRSGFYKWQRRRGTSSCKQLEDQFLKEKIVEDINAYVAS